MNWNEEVEAAFQDAHFEEEEIDGLEYEDGFIDGVIRGSEWQRYRLRMPVSIERGARALNESGWVCLDCNNEPDDYDQCKQCQEVCRNAFKSSLTALLGED